MMTPGFAKPRAELPWLPYPETNRMFVINAHNFPSAEFSPAVNGKMPIAAWIPTRSQSADDLVGSNDGTLLNGASIVSDTDAGGTHAFSFDGVNDRVDTFNISTACANAVSVSWWQRPRNPFNSTNDGFGSQNRAAFTQGITPPAFGVMHFSNNNIFAGFENSLGDFRVVVANSSAIWDQTQFFHWCITASENGTTSLYVNGVLRGTRTGTRMVYPASVLSIGSNGRAFSGWIDDFRIWSEVINSTDVSDLYASGNGRGVDAS